MKTLITAISLLTTVFAAIGQDQGAYTIFNAKGKKVKYSKMLKSLSQAQVILFGEYHDNPISHWLQLEVTAALLASNNLVLGAEMIEADNQDALNQYLAGTIDAKGLDTLARL